MREIRITENESGQRLDRFLRKLMKDSSLSEIYKGIRKGNIKVNGKKSKENYMLDVDDIISFKNFEFEPEAAVKKIANKPGNINVVYEDENIIVVDKPAGLLSHPQSSKDNDTLIHRIQLHIQSTSGPTLSPTFSPSLCNRLDRNTAGLVIAAKNYKSLKLVNEMIRDRRIKKLYLCVVKGSTDSKGEISGFLKKDEKSRKALIEDGGRESVTYYVKMDDNGQYSLLLVELVTGRFHQIRAHLSGIGHPIIGDVKYGDKKINDYFKNKYCLDHQLLLAYMIKVEDASNELDYLSNMTWYSTIPEICRNVLKDLFNRQTL
ncbi:RluA family pseudouridine synthase [Lutispora thermophila]|uniref:Pseudouridine synthase n=1 Tax=Lutispora thermophila DSM 19022 TaxID=1122184 RepID=A0A1M6CHE8_9FIRM|nr:RluA family pseudouridine synthase [Lutispora thermophila]SHI60442.1 23S rRNA pseudouridine955/2504/2580 synthase [Lutispora thermophila DSM 19022]